MKKLLLSLFVFLGTLASAGDVSAYLKGAHMDVAAAESALKGAGFEVVATYDSVADGKTIVFTDAALKAQAAKEGRAHAAVLRLFVDDKDKMISVTNPVYFGRAFMQDDYDDAVYSAELKKLNGAFAGLAGTKDKLDADDIGGFHFMMGMPYYEDAEELAEGSNADLIAKAKKAGGVVFELKLSDKSTLLGYDLSAETKGFVEKIGRANAAVLPYTIAVENGVAKSLHAKYYLAISYPLLSMGEFMTIANVPGDIFDELEKAFK